MRCVIKFDREKLLFIVELYDADNNLVRSDSIYIFDFLRVTSMNGGLQ